MASYTISPIWGAGAQLFDNNGNPLAGGKIYTYYAGSTTPLTTYTNPIGTVANSNPIIANSAGRLTNEIWFPVSGSYKFVLKDANDVLLATYDNIPTTPQPPIVNDASSISYQQGYEVNAGDFTIGATYLITSVGTTDFVAIGAAANQVGILFVATGIGSGTGTAKFSRTVEQKLQETVSVKDFGAVGDGVTDDTVAFQNAIDSAAYVNVYVPDGIYKITSTINVTTQCTLAGFDGGSQHSQAAKIYHDPSSTGSLFNVTTSVSGVCIRNLQITGGNGSFGITSSNSYVRYEFLRFDGYEGGGIQLLPTGVGSSSSKIANCEWIGPTTPTNYTGFEINVNGGDVLLYKCTAIYGAIGINVIQGQTIVIDGCSLNKQTITYGYSSATQFNTCGVRLTGNYYKQAISIRNSYFEACTNSIYVESCQSLTIQDNLIADSGVCGFDGNGNSCINLYHSDCKNVTIINNNIYSQSNGTVGNPFYIIYTNDAVNVVVFNNYINYTGSYAGVFYLISPTLQFQFKNTKVIGTSTPVADYAPNGAMYEIASTPPGTFTRPIAPTIPGTFLNSWGGSGDSVKYSKDALGYVHLEGTLVSGVIGSTAFQLPSGFRPVIVSEFAVASNNAYGTCYIDTSGNVIPLTGSNSSFHLDGITFRSA